MKLVSQIDMMKIREREIARLIEVVRNKSKNFTKPKLILIGGYALRAFVPFSRYTRDCDFALKKDNWHIDKIKNWFEKDVFIEAFEEREDYGFLRCIKQIKMDKGGAKVSIDFMEGQVAGRTEQSVVSIDERFVEKSRKTKIIIGDKEFEMFVPHYADYFIMKVISARPSDVRDIATLMWKNGIPKNIKNRIKMMLPYPMVFEKNLKHVIIPHISNKRFVDSWRGMFITTEFTEEIKKEVLKETNSLLSKLTTPK